jgi:hypothetical protein
MCSEWQQPPTRFRSLTCRLQKKTPSHTPTHTRLKECESTAAHDKRYERGVNLACWHPLKAAHPPAAFCARTRCPERTVPPGATYVAAEKKKLAEQNKNRTESKPECPLQQRQPGCHTTEGGLMRGGYAMMALLPTSLTVFAVVFVGMAVTAPAAAGSTRKVDVGFDPYMNEVSGKFSVSDCSAQQ